MLTAKVTQVQFGSFGSIEGLMDTEGTYYIAASQANNLLAFSAHTNNTSKLLKGLLGEASPPIRLKTELNSNPVTAITLSAFEKLLAVLDRKGNKQAQILRDSLVGLSIHQLFSDAFGIIVEKDERQLKLTQLLHHNKNFHPVFTSWLKLDGLTSGVRYGNEVNRLKVAAKVPLIPIQEYDGQQMILLNVAEARYDLARKLGKDHKEALQVI